MHFLERKTTIFLFKFPIFRGGAAQTPIFSAAKLTMNVLIYRKSKRTPTPIHGGVGKISKIKTYAPNPRLAKYRKSKRMHF